MMHLTTTERGRTSKALATGVTAALALSAVAVPAAFARPADPMHTAAADRALAAQGSTAPSDLRTPDATDAANAAAPQATASASPVKVVRTEQSSSSSFDWGDAAIGAGGTFVAIALSASAVMALSRRREHPSASETAGAAL
jgi:hypothetical protein